MTAPRSLVVLLPADRWPFRNKCIVASLSLFPFDPGKRASILRTRRPTPADPPYTGLPAGIFPLTLKAELSKIFDYFSNMNAVF
jgi:hypothetical protein